MYTGYAFVEMSELYDAKRAMRELDGTKHLDSTLKIQLTHNKGANKRSKSMFQIITQKSMFLKLMIGSLFICRIILDNISCSP